MPFGIFMNPKKQKPCGCTRIGDTIVDLDALEHERLFDGPLFSVTKDHYFCQPTLNDFAAAGKAYRVELRETLQRIFGEKGSLPDALKADALFPAKDVQMQMPMFIRDYTDFYSSYNHAYNVGVMVRGPDNAIQPNWKHLPVGYHGRASSIVVDGTPIIRPRGQVSADKVNPTWSKCNRMDFELELGTIVSHGNKMGHPIKVNDAREHIFGYVLLNDWSARDLQVWEYVPLGPFNAKNFGSTISPWVITPEALAPFKVALNKQEPELMQYLKDDDLHCYNVDLKVKLKTPKMENYHELATSNAKYLYYSVAQCLAHHTVTGCNFNTGDMIGSGTISGPEKNERGSILELCWGGKEPIKLPNDEERTFL